MRSTDVWHARNRIIRYSLSLISNATQRLLLFAFRTKRKQQHINNLNRKWNQIKIPKNKRCTHTIAHTVRQTKFIKSILQTNPNKQIENHSPVHAQKLKAFVCCVFAMAKRSLLPLLLHAQWLPALCSVVRAYGILFREQSQSHTITRASSHNTPIAYKLYESTRIFIFISISVVKITLWIPRTRNSASPAQCNNNHRISLLFFCFGFFFSVLCVFHHC